MIQRPDGLESAKVDFVFNDLPIKEVEVDLVHVNFGRSKKKERSNFDVRTVAKVCELFFADKRLDPIGDQVFGNELCLYFKLSGLYQRHLYRMVVCHCSDKPQTLGIITLFKEV